jgi:hypothetical protein
MIWSVKREFWSILMKPKFFLVGDSHMSMISRAAQEMEIPHYGGPLTAGRFINEYFFTVENGNMVFTLPDAQAHMQKYLSSTPYRNFSEVNIPIISTFGFSVTTFVVGRYPKLICYSRIQDQARYYLSSEYFAECVRAYNVGVLSFYQFLMNRGREVYVVYSPQRFNQGPYNAHRRHLALEYEKTFAPMLIDMGVKMIDVRKDTTDEGGNLLEIYRHSNPTDTNHSNILYGKIVIENAMQKLGYSITA